MVRTLSIAICLAAALAASANAAHAGFLNNANKVTGQVVKLEKLALKTPMTAGERLKFQGRLAVGATKCYVKAATSKPCF